MPDPRVPSRKWTCWRCSRPSATRPATRCTRSWPARPRRSPRRSSPSARAPRQHRAPAPRAAARGRPGRRRGRPPRHRRAARSTSTPSRRARPASGFDPPATRCSPGLLAALAERVGADADDAAETGRAWGAEAGRRTRSRSCVEALAGELTGSASSPATETARRHRRHRVPPLPVPRAGRGLPRARLQPPPRVCEGDRRRGRRGKQSRSSRRCTTPTRATSPWPSDSLTVRVTPVEDRNDRSHRHRHRQGQELIEAEDKPELCLRVAVRPGGCSGLSYEMFFDTDIAADDIERATATVQRRGRRPGQRAAPRGRVARLQGRPPGRRVHDQQPERAAHLRLRPVLLLSSSGREAAASGSRSRSDVVHVQRRARSRSTRAGRRVAAVVLRERLGLVSVKDGCAPQGQCGCCTVLVDGEPRVACVTPVARVAGRSVTTSRARRAARDRLAASFVATGGSQCGFCTPGIVMRVAGERRARSRPRAGRAPLPVHRLAHGLRRDPRRAGAAMRGARDLDARGAAGRARRRRRPGVGADVPLGGAPFADDTAPRDALVAVPLPPGSTAEAVDAAGLRWVVGESLLEARARGRQGAGPAHDRRAHGRRCSRPAGVPGGRGAARDVVGRARVPRARRVVVRAGR